MGRNIVSVSLSSISTSMFEYFRRVRGPIKHSVGFEPTMAPVAKISKGTLSSWPVDMVVGSSLG